MRFLVLPLLLLFLPYNHAHNWMTDPRPYEVSYKNTKNCRQGTYCNTACQRPKFGPRSNSQSSPARTYRRGQQITVKYTRNNHRGGFVRIALVPVDKMWSRSFHERMTIMHGCWEAGEYRCSGSECGTDKRNGAYKRTLKIPDVFPDGDYVLGHVWYGGIEFTRTKGFFGDFYSCSHVKISGGNPLSNTPFTPYWEPGEGEHVEDGKCQTSADAIGECEQGCMQATAFWSIPKKFKDGKKPPSITPSDVREGFTSGGGSGPTSVAGKTTGKPMGGKGICDGDTCCASSCGKCGGKACHKLNGGWRCCKKAIKKTGRRCSNVGPPCTK